MAKKGLLVLILGGFVWGSAFAQSEFRVSLGVGGYFTSDFGGGVEAKVGGIKAGEVKTPYMGGGAFAFFDLKYVEMNLGFFGFGGDWEDYGYGLGRDKYPAKGTGIDIGILTKYPFSLTYQLSIFPIFGMTYRAVLSAELDNVEADDPGDLGALWFKFGGGMDYLLTQNIYMRAGVLYGIRTSNNFEDDFVDYLTSYDYTVDAETLLGHGLEIKLAAGYRF